ncbi:PfkB family carbohydrate kinase [Parafrigoribacterium soli]|uniref:PfkB family carbohydrate kinase n=1 Tax=Parafrigoribacterium soli TaxID=3144663 RepID=UPI0032ED7E79
MRIVVVGDTLLDIDVRGAAERLSPEAPVPVVDASEIAYRPGGAGLAAILLARDGCDVTLVTALAADERAERLRSELEGVTVVSGASRAPTPTKMRISAHDHPIVRVDEDCSPAPEPQVSDAMIDSIASADAVLVADYGRGLTAVPRVRDALLGRARSAPLVWDPHPRGSDPVSSTTVVTPNVAEACASAGLRGTGLDEAASAATILRDRWSETAVAVTLGPQGVLLDAAASLPLLIPAPRVDPIDTCGAGDRLATALTSALARGLALPQALQSAVNETAVFLAAGGVGGLKRPANAVGMAGIDAIRIARETRARGGTVVATGGCFDLLHAGHARTLSAARALGDCLIVCLNSDASVRRLKGRERPIMNQADRGDLLTSLECVDAVLVFDEDTPEEALRRLEPHVWVKGGDYSEHELPESGLIETWGGRTVTVPYYPGRSTTGLASALARVG